MIQEKQPEWLVFFEQIFSKNRLSHAYLITGDKGSGKYELVMWIAQKLFCTHADFGKRPCGDCLTCRRIAANEYPDIIHIVPEGLSIKVDQVRQIKESFVRSGLESNKKVLIIEDAEKMTASAANSLLKFIEEPDTKIYIFFLTTQKGKILSTIQSRCQQINLLPLKKELIQQDLMKQHIPERTAFILSKLSESTEKAVELFEDEWFNNANESVQKWFAYIRKGDMFAFVFVQQKLVALCKEKEQQLLVLNLLLIYHEWLLKDCLETDRATINKLAGAMDEILLAQQKLSANLSFQNVSEQLSWRLLNQ